MQQSTQSPPPQAPPRSDSPIVVQVVKQPPVAPEIGMADVVLGAVGLTGAIILAALLTGLIAGVLIIAFKRWRERLSGDGSDHTSARLRI